MDATVPTEQSVLLPVRGNIPRLLCRGDQVWIVRSGTIAVFSVRVEHGRPAGARRYLFTRQTGDLLFGTDPTANPSGRSFLVFELEDSRVEEIDREVLVAQSEASPEDLAIKVDDWIRQISTVMAAGTSVTHATRLEPAEKICCDSQQSLRPAAQSVAWVSVIEGDVRILGKSHMSLSPATGMVPIGDDLCLTATDRPATLRLYPFAERDLLWDGAQAVERLHQFCFTHLEVLETLEEAAQVKRLGERQRLEQLDTMDALGQLTGILTKQDIPKREDTELLTALNAIGKQLGVVFVPPRRSEDLARVLDPVDAIIRASKIRKRNIVLTNNWWKLDAGPLLGYVGKETRPVALLRARRFFGLRQYYQVFDPRTMSLSRVTSRIDDQLSANAVAFVRPLPPTDSRVLRTLGKFALAPYRLEAVMLLLLTLATTLLAMLTPVATRLIIDHAIPSASSRLLLEWGLGLLAIAIGILALERSKDLFLLRVRTGITANLQNSVMDRMFRLPSKFFQRFSSGDLMNRVMMVSEVSREVSTTAVDGIISGGMAILNLGLCYYYSSKLALVAVGTAAVVAITSSVLSAFIRSRALRLERLSGSLFGFAVQLVGGVAKLRVAGAEQRAFNTWARKYAEQIALIDAIKRIQDWGEIINTGLRTASLALLFFFATKLLMPSEGAAGVVPATMLTMGTFLAFYSAFGTLVSGALSAGNTIVGLVDNWAKRKLMDPVLTAELEMRAGSVDPGRLNGEITLNAIEFRYRPDGPLILDGVSIHANPGEFIAIVGTSGCGKSTIFKLILGLETPEAGSVCFHGKDLIGLDMQAVRRQIGVVLQSGYINSGSIFECVSAGNRISLDEAWEAARDAGFEADIKEMPMGMHTVLPEGAVTLSGGQRQRLLIARALALNPKILLFDEATSALDNRTQEIVSRAVERRNVTRVVIAHRLSTIQEADRIYVLDGGHVVQSGTYDELVQQEGLFRRMAARQLT